MTYMTRFPINLARRAATKFLASPYVMHAAIEGSLSGSDVSAGNEGVRTLWRVDSFQNGSKALYIVSSAIPRLDVLNEQIGWPDEEPRWESKAYDDFLARLSDGQRCAFRLVANPVYRSSRVERSDGRRPRLPHVGDTHKIAWLIGADAYPPESEIPTAFRGKDPSRAERNGFLVETDPATGSPWIRVSETHTYRFRQRGKGRPITLATACYNGVMTITDVGALKSALVRGIGKAKGFGCGMLTVAPLSD